MVAKKHLLVHASYFWLNHSINYVDNRLSHVLYVFLSTKNNETNINIIYFSSNTILMRVEWVALVSLVERVESNFARLPKRNESRQQKPSHHSSIVPHLQNLTIDNDIWCYIDSYLYPRSIKDRNHSLDS